MATSSLQSTLSSAQRRFETEYTTPSSIEIEYIKTFGSLKGFVLPTVGLGCKAVTTLAPQAKEIPAIAKTISAIKHINTGYSGLSLGSSPSSSLSDEKKEALPTVSTTFQKIIPSFLTSWGSILLSLEASNVLSLGKLSSPLFLGKSSHSLITTIQKIQKIFEKQQWSSKEYCEATLQGISIVLLSFSLGVGFALFFVPASITLLIQGAKLTIKTYVDLMKISPKPVVFRKEFELQHKAFVVPSFEQRTSLLANKH